MLKKNKIVKKKNNIKRTKLIQKPLINCNLKIKLQIKNLIIENKEILFNILIKNYGLKIESHSFKQQNINRTVINKSPVCHSKSKESFFIIQTIDNINFSNQNLAQSLKFFIESEKFFLKKGSNQFKLSMNI